jgi:hypothetical protein
MTVVIGKPHFKNWFCFHLQMHRILNNSYSVGHIGRVNLVLWTRVFVLSGQSEWKLCHIVLTWRLQYNPFLKFYCCV